MPEEIIWSAWIDHDGGGCPCIGSYVQVRHIYDDEHDRVEKTEHIATENNHWVWDDPFDVDSWSVSSNGKKMIPVVQYRIAMNVGIPHSTTTYLMNFITKKTEKG